MGCGTTAVKVSYIVFNIILAFLGITAIAWIAFNNDAIQEESAIAIYVAGSLIVLFAFLGCFGAIRESICILATCAIFLLLLAILQITFTILDHSDLKETNAIDTVENAWELNKMDDLQNEYDCCGKISPQDYINLNKPIPNSCYRNVVDSMIDPKSLKTVGCVTQLLDHNDLQAVKFAIVSWVLVGFEILGFLLAVFLVINFRNKQRRMQF